MGKCVYTITGDPLEIQLKYCGFMDGPPNIGTSPLLHGRLSSLFEVEPYPLKMRFHCNV